ALLADFRQFVAQTSLTGLLVACADDPQALALAGERAAQGGAVVSYGIGAAGADWRATEIRPAEGGMAFTLLRGGQPAGQGRLRVPGQHNVLNALAALIVADRLGVPLAAALDALESFKGAGRRFDVRGAAGGVTVVDDYAHHPTAIRLTLAAARAAYPAAGIWAVWQPHTYSRLRALYNEFQQAFDPAHADHVLVTDVYAAREARSPDLDAAVLVAGIAHPDARYTPAFEDALAALVAGVQPGDVVIILSAGDAPRIGADLLARLGP
ncbi:MAG: UDP-N-acetylmuramate--L-alanine ligase, partial [Anaerolineae bacterium]|nr:UDP-N-acetylmuramate--L-alanine ligase [Anaerolineae bacterium]